MTRGLDSATLAASTAPEFTYSYFLKLEFDGGDVCLHAGLGNIVYGGDTYIGAGGIGTIGTAEENADLSRSTLSLQLRGLPNDLLAIILNEHYQGRTATLSVGYFDRTTNQLVADPTIIYRGRMDKPTVSRGKTCTVNLTVESRFASWDRPLVRRYNDADQQLRYPGDKGLEYVEQIVERQIFWGQKAP